MFNVVCDQAGHRWRLIVFLRQKQRPDAYLRKGKSEFYFAGSRGTWRPSDNATLDNYNIWIIYAVT
jgi:hypothetical protein